jgi:hypothetical protein
MLGCRVKIHGLRLTRHAAGSGFFLVRVKISVRARPITRSGWGGVGGFSDGLGWVYRVGRFLPFGFSFPLPFWLDSRKQVFYHHDRFSLPT